MTDTLKKMHKCWWCIRMWVYQQSWIWAYFIYEVEFWKCFTDWQDDCNILGRERDSRQVSSPMLFIYTNGKTVIVWLKYFCFVPIYRMLETGKWQQYKEVRWYKLKPVLLNINIKEFVCLWILWTFFSLRKEIDICWKITISSSYCFR